MRENCLGASFPYIFLPIKLKRCCQCFGSSFCNTTSRYSSTSYFCKPALLLSTSIPHPLSLRPSTSIESTMFPRLQPKRATTGTFQQDERSRQSSNTQIRHGSENQYGSHNQGYSRQTLDKQSSESIDGGHVQPT